MRWRYVFDETRSEADKRGIVADAIVKWWSAFAARADDIQAMIERRTEWNLPGWMDKNLRTISPDLMWEYGPCEEGTLLVITPETKGHLRPIVADLIKAAPVIPGWKFSAHRAPVKDLESVAAILEGRLKASIKDYRFIISRNTFNSINVTSTSPHHKSEKADVTFIALEVLLGEEVLDRWIGRIKFQPSPEPDAEQIAPGELRTKVEELISSIRGTLPDVAWASRTGEPTSYRRAS